MHLVLLLCKSDTSPSLRELCKILRSLVWFECESLEPSVVTFAQVFTGRLLTDLCYLVNGRQVKLFLAIYRIQTYFQDSNCQSSEARLQIVGLDLINYRYMPGCEKQKCSLILTMSRAGVSVPFFQKTQHIFIISALLNLSQKFVYIL